MIFSIMESNLLRTLIHALRSERGHRQWSICARTSGNSPIGVSASLSMSSATTGIYTMCEHRESVRARSRTHQRHRAPRLVQYFHIPRQWCRGDILEKSFQLLIQLCCRTGYGCGRRKGGKKGKKKRNSASRFVRANQYGTKIKIDGSRQN